MKSCQEIIVEQQERLLELNESIQTIQAAADGEQRDLADEEINRVENLMQEFEAVKEDIERRRRILNQTEKLAESVGRRTEPQEPEPQNEARREPQAAATPPRRRGGSIQVIEDRGKWGWKAFGEFAQKVKTACGRNTVEIDPRLVVNTSPTTVSTEGVGSDGGFLVPPDFRQQILEKVLGEDSLVGRTDQIKTSSNMVTFPKDETTPWDASSGVQAYWEGEARQATQSKIDLEPAIFRLNKLIALVPVTEELMDDASGLESYLVRKAIQKFDFKVNLAIVQGNGKGQPLGLLNSPCVVTTAKESGQGADTIRYENIVKMWSRLYAACRKNAVWLIDQDIEPQLFSMSMAVGTGGVPVYLPANGLSGSPYATLLGRPLIPTEACNTLGDKGDIILGDLTQYMTAVKVGGLRQQVSIHLWFDWDIMAFKFTLRIAGQPWWSSSITPRTGGNTRSCFVTLEERA
jgi:HK97 family phage major capsid protein